MNTKSYLGYSLSNVLFGITIFLCAFLLFQIQPMIAKAILPWFGGAPSVWTVCMIFYQTMLLVGYACAHLIFRFVRPKFHWMVYVLIIAVSF